MSHNTQPVAFSAQGRVNMQNRSLNNLGTANPKLFESTFGLANTVIRVLNSSSKIQFIRKDYADVELRIPSVEKARSLIGFEAKIDLEEGIARTAEYYASRLNA